MNIEDRPVQDQQNSLAIVFADISQSTRLYKKLGDVRALEIVSRALLLLQDATSQNEGRTIKTIGDELMCVFIDANHAVSAACDMQKAVKSDPLLVPLNVSIRIGLHFGEVICEQNDVFGDAVNLAARAVALAKADEIITTGPTLEKVSKEMFLNVRFLGHLKTRGRDMEADFFEILWQENNYDATIIHRYSNMDLLKTVLCLEYKNKSYLLDDKVALAEIGRDEQNNIVTDNIFVSRRHASIEINKGKVILKDYSSNGTYVQIESDEVQFIHREEVQLRKNGKIGLGCDINNDDAAVIYYSIS